MTIIISQEQRKQQMGCVPERTKKQTRDNQHNTQMTENWLSISGNPVPGTPLKTTYSQKEAYGHELHAKNGGQLYNGNGQKNEHNQMHPLEQLVSRYRIVVKQAIYKTNSIHTFNYQPMITFNPALDNVMTAERDGIDKTYNINLSRQLISHSKLLLSRR